MYRISFAELENSGDVLVDRFGQIESYDLNFSLSYSPGTHTQNSIQSVSVLSKISRGFSELSDFSQRSPEKIIIFLQ